jgi:tricorn protease
MAPPPDAAAGGYYSHPALHGDALAFVCEDEAWVTSLSGGGVPRRLSATAGGCVSHLRFSPDGTQLAFSVAEAGYEEARRRRGARAKRANMQS